MNNVILSEMQRKMLALLQKEGVLTTKLVSESLHLPVATVFRHLDALVHAGHIVRIGKGRAVAYVAQTGATLRELDELKKKLDAYRPLPPEIVKNIEYALISRFVYSTNGIEGSRLTLRETDMVLSGATIKGNQQEVRDVKNQKKAIDHIAEYVRSGNALSEEWIKSLQKIVTGDVHDVFLNGVYRDNTVGISGTEKTFPSASEIPLKMKELIIKLNRMEEKKTHAPVIAAYAHYHLTAIHPFFDGNGRTARLVMNAILLRHKYPMAVVDLSERQTYYQVLQQADNGFYELFEAFIFHAIKKSLELYLRVVGE